MKYPEQVNPKDRSRLMVARGWGGKNKEWLFNEYGVYFLGDETFRKWTVLVIV